MSTPDFVLQGQYTYYVALGDPIIFKPGMFLRPINLRYVPKHVVERRAWTAYYKDKDVYCYTSVGIYPFPRDLIRQVAGSKALDIMSYE